MNEKEAAVLPEAVGEEEYSGKEEYIEEVSTPGLIFEDVDGYYTVTGYRGEDTEVVIPSTYEGHPVTGIGDSAFAGCTHLRGITIPNSVTSIGRSAFSGCTSLSGVTIPSSVKRIQVRTFSGCTSLTSINIPDGVTDIGPSMFSGCTALTDITIPDSVKKIFIHAFEGCTSLRDITIPRGVKVVDGVAFEGCTNLTISCEAAWKPRGWSKHWNYKGGRVIWGARRNASHRDGRQGLGKRGKTIVISLLAVVLLGIIIAVEVLSGSKFVMTDMGDYYEVSGYNGSLTEIVIPSKYKGKPVSSIGANAFSGCTSLTSVTIPDSVTSIGAYAFSYCTGLTSITIPGGATSIGHYAFSGCTSLRGITISNTVTSIGNFAFEGCTGLTSIEVAYDNPTYRSIDGNLYDKSGKALIQYATGKEDTSFVIPDSVTGIGYYAFSDCTSLTSINIPDSVTSIGYYAFEGCTSLTSINIPDGVTDIGVSMFSGCTSLRGITIPDSVTSIDSYAFSGCTSLTSITIPHSVTIIDYLAFRDCTNITILCEAEEQPIGWHYGWNYSNCPVVWGYKAQ